MQLKELQVQVDDWIAEHGGYWTPLNNFTRLVEEVGEVARHLNAADGRKRLPADAEPLIGEFGDLLFVLAALANQLDLDLDQAGAYLMRKLARAGGAATGDEK